MTELCSRFLNDLMLAGLSDRTCESYVHSVKQLAYHYHKSPDLITTEELRQYFLYCKNAKRWARSTSTIAICAIKFFYENTLRREWKNLGIIRAGKVKKLPVVLSQEEVFRVLKIIRIKSYDTCLFTIYSCGLRISECTHLKVKDIDGKRGYIHIKSGKGGKDRYVPLPDITLGLLRAHWKTHRNPEFLFPTSHSPATAKTPVSLVTIQQCFKKALILSKINKKASVHTLRHSYATHLLEAGISLQAIQKVLGHNSMKSTFIYTHLTETAEKNVVSTINRLMGRYK